MAAVHMLRRQAAVSVLLTSVSLLLTCIYYLTVFSQPETATVATQQAKSIFAPLTPGATCLEGVVTVLPGGRLGNLILEYASAATVARRHHLLLAVPSDIWKPLSAIFDNLTAEPLSKLLQQPPCKGHYQTEEKVLDDLWKQFPPNASVEEIVQWAQSQHQPVILRHWIILPSYLAASLEFLRKEFRFRAEIQTAANKKLDKITAETAHKTGCKQTQVCTVGVHVRRTDYGAYLKQRFNLQHLAGADYYQRAAAAMLADLQGECAAVAFAITSDDNQWCQKHLLPALTRKASNDSVASMGFLMSSKQPADDLCLLSSCQHLIMAYGTFALSAAILSGGRTVMYDTESHGASSLPAAQMMSSLVPHWRLVS